jgi:tetratricopeptide (TPR) repeat protein
MKIGRYRLLRELGRGGQGTVWAAVDGELGRDLALKLVRSSGDANARARLLREARALAAIEHPNVVKIFDAFTHDDELVLAMELIVGSDLATWCRTKKPRLAARLAAIEAAGRGLLAAHDAGLVHRDFKPSNVLVRDHDGSVVVTDFGLVRMDAPDPAFVTDPRTRLGTVGYMAPEQMMGAPVDAAADQFAFSVALFELIYETRPFAGKDFGELVGAIAQRRIRSDRRVPRRLAAVVERGLDPDPARRYPSMSALLQALASARRSRLPVVLAGGVTLGVLAAIVALRSPSAASARLQRWSSADVIFETARAALRDRTMVPLSTAIETGQYHEAERLALAFLASPDAELDPSLRDHARQLLGQAQLKLGHPNEAERTLEQVVLDATERGDFERVALASVVLIEIVGITTDRADEALEWIRRAEVAAARSGIDIELMLADRRAGIAYRRGDLAAAEAGYLEAIEIETELDGDDPELGPFYNGLGAVYGTRGDYELAVEYFRRTLETHTDLVSAEHDEVLLVRVNLGRALVFAHHVEEGLAELRDVVATSERAYGRDDPSTLNAIVALADVHVDLRQYAAAVPLLRRALARVDTDDFPLTERVRLSTMFAEAELGLGRVAEAEDAAARAITLGERLEGHPTLVAMSQFVYARAAWASDRRQVAARAGERAYELAVTEPSDAEPTAARIDAWLREVGLRDRSD